MTSSAQLIDSLGGPKKVAELLGITVPGAIQRVSNWKRRGIPPAVLIQHPGIFRSLIWPELAEVFAPPPTLSSSALASSEGVELLRPEPELSEQQEVAQ